tara:strand:+ start:2019 stop:2201 length:183 start_codon:yes stop_codon:yes gene_type:complete
LNSAPLIVISCGGESTIEVKDGEGADIEGEVVAVEEVEEEEEGKVELEELVLGEVEEKAV